MVNTGYEDLFNLLKLLDEQEKDSFGMEDCTMSIKITKTPQQAELENRTKRVDNICPCCGHKEPYGTYYLKGLFVIKEVHCYKCRNCGCEWEVEEKL